MEPGRGSLVDKCWRCGTWLRRAAPAQHAALQMVLEDIALQVAWPTHELRERFPHVKPMLHGVQWWWEMGIQAFDRLTPDEGGDMAPALDGQGFDGRGFDFVRGARKRRQLNDHEISKVIEYFNAFAAGHQVKRRRKEKVAA